MGQTIAEADTTAEPAGVGGWTKHAGVWVTTIPGDDGTIAAFVAWTSPGAPAPDREQAMAAFVAYAAQDGVDLPAELAAVGYVCRETWARRIPVEGGDPPVYAEIADGWRLQIDACPLDGDTFEVLALEPGPAVPAETPDSPDPEETP